MKKIMSKSESVRLIHIYYFKKENGTRMRLDVWSDGNVYLYESQYQRDSEFLPYFNWTLKTGEPMEEIEDIRTSPELLSYLLQAKRHVV